MYAKTFILSLISALLITNIAANPFEAMTEDALAKVSGLISGVTDAMDSEQEMFPITFGIAQNNNYVTFGAQAENLQHVGMNYALVVQASPNTKCVFMFNYNSALDVPAKPIAFTPETEFVNFTEFKDVEECDTFLTGDFYENMNPKVSAKKINTNGNQKMKALFQTQLKNIAENQAKSMMVGGWKEMNGSDLETFQKNFISKTTNLRIESGMTQVVNGTNYCVVISHWSEKCVLMFNHATWSTPKASILQNNYQIPTQLKSQKLCPESMQKFLLEGINVTDPMSLKRKNAVVCKWTKIGSTTTTKLAENLNVDDIQIVDTPMVYSGLTKLYQVPIGTNKNVIDCVLMLLLQEERKMVSVLTDKEFTKGPNEEANLGDQFKGVDFCNDEIKNKFQMTMNGSQLYAILKDDAHVFIKNEMLSKVNGMLGSWQQVTPAEVTMIREFIFKTKKDYKLVFALHQSLAKGLYYFVINNLKNEENCSVLMTRSVNESKNLDTTFSAANPDFLKTVFPCSEEIAADFINVNEVQLVKSNKNEMLII